MLRRTLTYKAFLIGFAMRKALYVWMRSKAKRSHPDRVGRQRARRAEAMRPLPPSNEVTSAGAAHV
jgi:hypothetical protein